MTSKYIYRVGDLVLIYGRADYQRSEVLAC